MTTSSIRESGRSVLLMHRITGSLAWSALRSTKRVCGSGPSEASTSRTTASTMDRPRSTSPPKSAWPGVSMMLMVTGSPPSAGWYFTAVFFARMVMPFSRSRSLESMTRSSTCWWAANAPACLSMASTRVVLPWSTWATMATLRMSWRVGITSALLPVSWVAARSLCGAPSAGLITPRPHPHGTGTARGRMPQPVPAPCPRWSFRVPVGLTPDRRRSFPLVRRRAATGPLRRSAAGPPSARRRAAVPPRSRLGRVSKVPPAPRRLARALAALSGSSE
ncbi:hypothetical protein JOF35_005608 [Streptomyces demainii]|uniref:Uncharacterized protein n=1 Tax=Streptomyces demainii TaxID=588122 RepID=A0ABT9KXV6_9ACTN|nr:hypothetical protein [Streptomyces demainii]